jgi:hypothetical protein
LIRVIRVITLISEFKAAIRVITIIRELKAIRVITVTIVIVFIKEL